MNKNTQFGDDQTVPKDGISEFLTYEDYLDNEISEVDLFYLEDEDLARQVVELGWRGTGETIKREDFENRKREIEERKLAMHSKQIKSLSHTNRNYKGNSFLESLAEREEANRNGKLTTIIFIRDKNSKNQEISGYIDYAHRLKIDDFSSIFDSSKKLLPKASDLSYYNWETQVSTSNVSPTFTVIADSEEGLIFKNKRDRKHISVDPNQPPSDNCQRTVIKTKDYIQVVLYDHVTRRN